MAAAGPSVASEVKKCCPIQLCTFMKGNEKEVLHHVTLLATWVAIFYDEGDVTLKDASAFNLRVRQTKK